MGMFDDLSAVRASNPAGFAETYGPAAERAGKALGR